MPGRVDPRDLLDPSAVPPYRLWCVYAEGVDLAKLTSQQRSLSCTMPELVVGRTAQAPAVWDTLVPDRRLHSTVSREHLKVLVRRSSIQESTLPQASFQVLCLSLNGVMLNGHFIGNDSGEHSLQHGDAIALATVVDVTTPENQSRKPFVVFQFEVLGPSPMAEALPTAFPSEHIAPPRGPFEDLDDSLDLLHPPSGTVAGRWLTSSAVEAPPDALYCLEVHGDELRPNLPAEVRQLFFCCEAQGPRPPRLRVGRYYQRGFWESILSEEILTGGTLWGSMMAQDHFEIIPARRNNPQLMAEPEDWRFRLRVLSHAGVVLNYSTMVTAHDERELSPSDTLTVKRPSDRNSRLQGAPESGLPGLHFTFIPLVGPLVQPLPTIREEGLMATPSPPGPRAMLPELTDSETEDPRPGAAPVAPVLGALATALQPPTGVLHLRRDSDDDDQAQDFSDGQEQPALQTVKTRILAPPAWNHERTPLEVSETDDLFARTGFEETPEVEGHAMVSDGYARRAGSGSKPPGWLPSFSC